MNNNRDAYSYGGVILGLRKEYQKNQKILNKLNDLINTEYKDGTYKELYVDTNDSLPSLRLNITNKQNKIKRQAGKVILDLKKNNGNFSFVDSSIEIIDMCEFNEAYNELKESPLFQEKSVLINLNPFQEFSLVADSIRLNTRINLKGKKHVLVSYNAKDDHVEIRKNCWQCIDIGTFYGILDTAIPNYVLPRSYIDILKNSEDSSKSLWIDLLKQNDVLNGNYEITDSKRLVKKAVYF